MRDKLKEAWEDNFTWIGAHAVALMAEGTAVDLAIKSYHQNHSFQAFVLPIIGIMPWVGAMAAKARYKRINEPKVETAVRRDISCELGGVVLSAYLLFMFAIIK